MEVAAAFGVLEAERVGKSQEGVAGEGEVVVLGEGFEFDEQAEVDDVVDGDEDGPAFDVQRELTTAFFDGSNFFEAEAGENLPGGGEAGFAGEVELDFFAAFGDLVEQRAFVGEDGGMAIPTEAEGFIGFGEVAGRVGEVDVVLERFRAGGDTAGDEGGEEGLGVVEGVFEFDFDHGGGSGWWVVGSG